MAVKLKDRAMYIVCVSTFQDCQHVHAPNRKWKGQRPNRTSHSTENKEVIQRIQKNSSCLSHVKDSRSYLSTFICLIEVQLRTEVPSTPSSTLQGFELMTSRS